MWFRAVPVAVAGRFARKGDEVTGNLKVPQPARRRRGVTLIEAVLYVAVSLGLIVGGLVFYQQAVTSSRTASFANLLSYLVAETRSAMEESTLQVEGAAFGDYLIARGSVPASAVDMSFPPMARIRNPWGGVVSIGPLFGGGGGAAGEYVISVLTDQIPVSTCTRLVTVSGNSNINIYSTGVINSFVYETFPGSPLFGTVTLSQAGQACRAADTNRDGRVVVWQFLKLHVGS